ncbi:MAG: hypothetical protein Kow0080_24210 [Candidatus Promineifilaceae bacterium]
MIVTMLGILVFVLLMVTLSIKAMSNGIYSVGESPAPGVFSLILLAVLIVAYAFYALNYFA